MTPEVTAFFDEPTNTVSYVVRDPGSNSAAIIDSVLDFDQAAGRITTASADEITAFVKDNALSVEWILETHVHADHLSAAPYIQEKTGGKIGIGSEITTVQETFGKVFNAGTEFQRDGSQFDQLFREQDRFDIGALSAFVLHTPGHTPACLTYVIGDAAFVGDTLFMPDFGTARCDFPAARPNSYIPRSRKSYPCPTRPASLPATTTRHRVATSSPGKQPLPSKRRRMSILPGQRRKNSSPCAPKGTQNCQCQS